MGVHAQSATATVDPSIVWERWTEPEYWPQDDPSILRAKRNGPLAKGAVGVLRWKKGGRSTYRIVEVDRSALRFVTETKLPLATVTYERELARPEVVSDAEGAVDVDPKDVRMLGGVMHEQVLEHLLHGRQRVALQRVFKVAERRTAGCGAQPHGRQKGRIIVDGVVVIQVFLADQNAGQTLDEVAELSASATTLLVGKRGGDDALDNVITT